MSSVRGKSGGRKENRRKSLNSPFHLNKLGVHRPGQEIGELSDKWGLRVRGREVWVGFMVWVDLAHMERSHASGLMRNKLRGPSSSLYFPFSLEFFSAPQLEVSACHLQFAPS
jgi:hypothetical protein